MKGGTDVGALGHHRHLNPIGVEGVIDGCVVDIHSLVDCDKPLLCQIPVGEYGSLGQKIVSINNYIVGVNREGAGNIARVIAKILGLLILQIHAGDKNYIQFVLAQRWSIPR